MYNDKPIDQLLAELREEFPPPPPDPRVEHIKKYRDYLLDSDYEHLLKMVNTFDLSIDELNEELIRYGVDI